jgi:hypothetical protein
MTLSLKERKIAKCEKWRKRPSTWLERAFLAYRRWLFFPSMW